MERSTSMQVLKNQHDRLCPCRLQVEVSHCTDRPYGQRSPDASNSVLLETAVGTDHWYVLDERLCHEKAVEWVEVIARKLRLLAGILHRDGQDRRLETEQRLIHPF